MKKERISREELKAYFPEAFKDVSLDKIRPKEFNSYMGSRLEEVHRIRQEEAENKRRAVLKMLREDYDIES